MFIKLSFKNESEKAYQLDNGIWIPKSVLDKSGLTHPYYAIKAWWINIQNENIRTKPENFKYLDRKKIPTDADVVYSKNVINGIKPLIISNIDLPDDIKEQYIEYWRKQYSDVGSEPVDWDDPVMSESMNYRYH